MRSWDLGSLDPWGSNYVLYCRKRERSTYFIFGDLSVGSKKSTTLQYLWDLSGIESNSNDEKKREDLKCIWNAAVLSFAAIGLGYRLWVQGLTNLLWFAATGICASTSRQSVLLVRLAIQKLQ